MKGSKRRLIKLLFAVGYRIDRCSSEAPMSDDGHAAFRMVKVFDITLIIDEIRPLFSVGLSRVTGSMTVIF